MLHIAESAILSCFIFFFFLFVVVLVAGVTPRFIASPPERYRAGRRSGAVVTTRVAFVRGGVVYCLLIVIFSRCMSRKVLNFLFISLRLTLALIFFQSSGFTPKN